MNRSRKRSTMLVALAGGVLLLLAAMAAFAGDGNAAQQAPPRNTEPPTITGTPQEGERLTGDRGEFSNNPTDYNFNWRRCGKNGGSCSNISGANGRTYLLTSADVGNTIRFRVEAVNADGRVFASSVPTAIIRGAPAPPPPPAPAVGCAGNAPVQVASIQPPDRLNVDRQDISPSVVGRSSRTITLRFRVVCRGKPVQGALVYATAVPFSQYSIPPEATTGADGVAQLTMNQARFFPASDRQQLLVVFVRARKQGEPLLGGVSTRRLVSFPVNLSR